MSRTEEGVLGTVDLRDQEIIDKGRVKEAGREKYVGFRAPKAAKAGRGSGRHRSYEFKARMVKLLRVDGGCLGAERR